MTSKILCSLIAVLITSVATGSPEDILQGYENAGAGPFDPVAGRTAWIQEHRPTDGGDARSCVSCHGRDLTRPGKHVKTGKAIEPLAVSVNPGRLTDPKKVEKWFRRNCRWTRGRECTPQEKGDFVRYITSQ